MGGLFGSRLAEDGEVLGWTRAQQAAFLIYAWDTLRTEIKGCSGEWAKHLRREGDRDEIKGTDDPAFYGRYSLIVTDQGVRGYLHVLNDLCFAMAARLKLDTWRISGQPAATDEEAVNAAIKSLKKHPVGKFLKDISHSLTGFDWRTSGTPNISEEIRRNKLVFRGGSGYKELRSQLLEHLAGGSGDVGKVANRLLNIA